MPWDDNNDDTLNLKWYDFDEAHEAGFEVSTFVFLECLRRYARTFHVANR